MIDTERGLYGKYRVERLDGKYRVERLDGSSEPGEKHEHCEYYVLDLHHDKFAAAALAAYAEACAAEYPALASDLSAKVKAMSALPKTRGGQTMDDTLERLRHTLARLPTTYKTACFGVDDIKAVADEVDLLREQLDLERDARRQLASKLNSAREALS